MSKATNPTNSVEDNPDRLDIKETKWFEDLLWGIYGPRKGGARIIIDAQDAATGSGKTSLAVYLARFLSAIFGYDIGKDDVTLSGETYLERWQDHPDKEQPSVIILDELAGAGAGNARRAMSNQNVQLGSSWQTMRKKRIVTICTVPHWGFADRIMQQQADFRLWCLKEPIGHFVPYEVGAGFDDGDVTTRGYADVDEIAFPDMDRLDDPLFRHLEEKKDELLESEHFDADEVGKEDKQDPDEARRQQKIEIAQRMRDSGDTVREIADNIGMSHTWVIENTESSEGET